MNLERIFKSFMGLLGMTLMVQGVLWASTGKIRGTVVDAETGELLIGANIVIQGTTMGAASDENGEYIILDVPVGIYSLVAIYMGYQKITVENVVIATGLTTFQDFSMPEMVLEGQEVVIVAERPLVNKNATNDIKIIRSEDIEAIPVRGYLNVVAAQAGAVKSGANIHVRGGRLNEVGYYIDGVLMNDPYRGSQVGDINHNAIEEISYQPGGMNAEYGGFNSGIVNVITKTGGSKLTVSGEVISDQFLGYNEKRFGLGTYSYGFNLYSLSMSGPVPMTEKQLRFYGNLEYRFRRDSNPSWGPSVAPSVFHKDIDRMLELNPEPVPLYGAKKNNHDIQWTGVGNLYFPLRDLKFKIGGHFYKNDYRNYIHLYAPFNWQNMPRGYLDVYSGYAKATYIIGPTAFMEFNGNYFWTKYEYGDFKIWDDFFNWANPEIIPNLTQWGSLPSAEGRFANFHTYGRPQAWYYRENTQRLTFRADGTWQVNKYHELRAGFEAQLNTVRFYDIGWLVSSALHLVYEAAAEKGREPTAEEIAFAYRSGYANNAGYDITGKNRVNSGDDDARRPKIYSGYIQDKMEFRDIVLNLGLRVDHIMISQKRLKDNYNVILDENGLIAKENFLKPAVYTVFNPRIGFAFPVTDRTVFHLEYGQFTQPPPFDVTYVTWHCLAANLKKGDYTTSPNPGLRPVKTTSYEIGFEQQIGSSASLDITAFYKEIKDQIYLLSLVGAQPAVYSGYMNGDFGNVKGFSIDFHLGRTHRVMGNVNYTLQWANGTGSDPNTQYNIAWMNPLERPTYVAPLDYDQRHTATINIDFRTHPEDGPEVFGIRPLGNMGLNVWFTYGSGLAYTPETPTTIVFGGTGSLYPLSAINSAHQALTSMLNFKLDRRFKIGPITVNPYIWVVNVFNKKNYKNVYNATGLPDEDGWFTTLEGQTWAKTNPDAARWYHFREADPENYGKPRQILIGVRFDYK